MGVNRVDFGGNTLIDLTGDPLETAEQLLKGIIAHAKDGSVITGLMEAGGGGGINATAGTITVSSDANNYVLTHGLGEVPKFFVIGMIEKYKLFSNKTYLLIGTYGFSDTKTQYRIGANSSSGSVTGVYRESAINDTVSSKGSLLLANEETIQVADSYGTNKLIAGATYYWVAVGNGVF